MASGDRKSQMLKINAATCAILKSGSPEYEHSPLAQDVSSKVGGDATVVPITDRGLRMSVLAVYAYRLLWNTKEPAQNPPPDLNRMMNNPAAATAEVTKNIKEFASVCMRVLYCGYVDIVSPNG